VEWFRQVGLYEPLTEYDTETGKHRILVNSVQAVPLQLSVVVGDFAHNLRSALDHLWCAILKAQGQPVTRRSQFPIVGHEPKTPDQRDAWRKQIGTGLPDELITMVEDIQPYKATQVAPIEWHPLYVLNELDRRDKHFAINLVAVNSLGSALQIGDRIFTSSATVELVPGAVVGEFTDEEIGHSGPIHEEMNVKLGAATQIVFKESWGQPGVTVDEALVAMFNTVTSIIGSFERFVPPHPGPAHPPAP
jgi:hypothetical protein